MSYKVKKATELSRRELEVARLIAADSRPADTAAKLNISVKSVSTYRARILEKLRRTGVRGNCGIARYVAALNNVGPPKWEDLGLLGNGRCPFGDMNRGGVACVLRAGHADDHVAGRYE
jgi:hypothetical protein